MLRTQAGFSDKKTKEQRTCVRCSWLVPSPRYFAKLQLLVERVESQDARFGVGALSSRVHANHCLFLSAEAANTGLVDGDRRRLDGVANVDATSHRACTGREHVAALSAAARVTVVG